MSESIVNPVFFVDPARIISETVGKEFLDEVGATRVHRLGLMEGIGFRLPEGEARDGINLVHIRAQRHNRFAKWEGLCRLTFFKSYLPEDHLCEPENEQVATVGSIPLSALVAKYWELI